jgi:hypothetical protein
LLDLQSSERRSVQHLSVDTEARAMTGAVPALLERIPVDDTSEVGTDRGSAVESAGLVPVYGHFPETVPHDGPVPRSDLVFGADLSRRDVVGVLPGDVEVLF